MTRAIIAIAVCTAASNTPLVSASAQDVRLVTVGPNVQVSAANGSWPHYELLACGDPAKPRQLLVGSIAFPDSGEPRTMVYASTDGGATWRQTLTAGVGDPACAFGTKGEAYFAALSPNEFYRSADGGITWDPPVKLPAMDREYITVDHSKGASHGTVYVNATMRAPRSDSASPPYALGILTSRNSGRSFAGARYRLVTGTEYVLPMGNSVVLSDGSLVSIHGVALKRSEHYLRPRTTYLPPPHNFLLKAVRTPGAAGEPDSAVLISQWWADRFGISGEGAVVPSIAVDPGSEPFKDRMYVVWPDVRSGRVRVMLAWSADSGRTWSPPRAVVDDAARADGRQGPDATNVSIAVNKHGVVMVGLADRREHADNRGWWYRVAVSTDGGETFSPSIKVSSAPNRYDGREILPVHQSPYTPVGEEPHQIRLQINSFFFTSGHTVSIVADADGVFHPFWCDNRTGVSHVWTARVTVNAMAVRNGSQALASHRRVSSRVRIELGRKTYDEKAKRLTVQAWLRNTSSEPLRGPLTLRVVGNDDAGLVGIPGIANADNGRPGAGATFQFMLRTRGAVLSPGEQTLPRELVFIYPDVRRPYHDRLTRVMGLLNVQANILAP